MFLFVGAAVVAVAVALAVAVAAVAVAVAVVAVVVLGVGAVEQDSHVVVLLLVVVLLQLGQHAALQQAGTDDEDRDVGLVADDRGVGDNLHRRAVDEDVVVVLAQLVEHRLELRRVEQLGGVGGYLTHRQDVDGLHGGAVGTLLLAERMVDDELAVVVGLAAEVVRQALLRLVDELRQGAAAQVEVDADDAAVADGERRAEVGGDERLAAAGVERREHDNLTCLLLVGHELQVRTHHAVGLVGDVAAVLAHHEAVALGYLLALLGLPQGQLADVGDGEVLEVLTTADLRVAHLAEDEEGGGKGQGDGEGHQQDAVTLWGGGLAAAPRVGDDARVVGGERLRQLVLLALLQEEEIQRLLHLLLALERQQVVLLLRSGRQAAHGSTVGRLHRVELGGEGGLRVVEGLQDGAAQVAERHVDVAHQRVLLAGVRHEVVTLEDARVIFSNLLLDGTTADARAGGHELLGVGGVDNVVTHVAHHIQLVVNLLTLGVGGSLLADGLTGGLLNAEHAVGALVGGDAALDVAEFTLDDGQALLDELIGGDAHLVAVLHPVLVVDIDDRLQDIVGTRDGVVDTLDIDDVTRLGLEAGGDEGTVAAGGSHIACATDEDGRARILFIIKRRGHGDGTEGRLALRAHLHAAGAAELFAAEDEVAQHGRTVAAERQAERGGGVIVEVVEFHLYGERLGIQRLVAEIAGTEIAEVEVQALHQVVDDGRGVDGHDLVGDVGRDVVHAEVLDQADVVGLAAAALDKHGGRAGVGLGGTQQVEGGAAHEQGHGEDEPGPVAQAEHQHVHDAQRVVGHDATKGRNGCCCLWHIFRNE